MESEEFDITRLWESVAHNLLQLCMRDVGDKDFEVALLGHEIHLKVTGVSTNTEIKIVGEEEYNDLGEQLVLACIQNLSAGDLAELSLKVLNKDADVRRSA